MIKKYEVVVGSHSFELDENDLRGLELHEIKEDSTVAHFNGLNHKLKSVNQGKSGKYWLAGKAFHYQIKNDLDVLVDKMGLSSVVKVLTNELQSPMPGLVFKILVKVGDEIKEGDQIMILEAMKMENILLAERDGFVKEICCKEGDAVEKKQILITFE